VLKNLEKWHYTKLGLAIFGLGEAGLAYLFASLAIPTAHTWEWALAVVFSIGTLQNFGRLIRKFIYGKPQTSTAKQD